MLLVKAQFTRPTAFRGLYEVIDPTYTMETGRKRMISSTTAG
jgi:hypothetical protein